MNAFSRHVDSIATGRTDLETAVEELYSQLNPKEKLWLLDGDSTAKSFAGRYVAEGYCFRPHNAGVIDRLGIPGIRFTDGPRGILMGHNCTAFPTSSTRACTWDPELEERVVGFSSKTKTIGRTVC
jgi:beta-glucosidase